MNNLEQINTYARQLFDRGYSAPQIDAELRRVGVDPTKVAAQNRQNRALGPQRVGRSLAQGLTLGFADEIEAGVTAALDPTVGYRDQLDVIRAENEAFRQHRPGVALTTELVGGLATGGVGGARAAGGMAARGLLSPTGRNIATGAGVGALEGLGHSTGTAPGDMWRDALLGGVTGGVVGGLAPPVLNAAAAPLRAAGRAVRDNLGSTQTSRAAREVNKAIQRDRTDFAAMAERMRQYGQGAMPLDVAGPSVRQLGEAAMPYPGQVQSQLKERLQERAETQHGRVLDELYRGTGQPGNLKREMDAVTARQRAEGKVNYDLARQTTPEFTDDLQELISRPDVSDAWAIAKRSASNQGRPLPEYFELDAEGKIIGVREIPDMEAWDWIKRGLDAKIERETTVDPLTGRDKISAAGRDTARLKNQLVDILDAGNPDYAKARGAWAREAQIKEAAEQGRKIFRDDAEVSREYVEGLPGEAMAGYRLGATRAIEDEIKRVPVGNTIPRRAKFSAPLWRERQEPAFTSQEAFDNFLKRMDTENEFARTRNTLTGGSQTQPRQVAAEELGLSGMAETATDVATGGAGGIVRAIKQVVDRVMHGPGLRPEDAADALRILSTENPAEFVRLMRTGAIPHEFWVKLGEGLEAAAPGVPGAAAATAETFGASSGIGSLLFGADQ